MRVAPPRSAVTVLSLLSMGCQAGEPALTPVQQAAVEDVTSRAFSLLEVGCPLSFVEASFNTTVNGDNRDSIVTGIVETTATVVASDFECRDVMTLQEGREAGLVTAEDVAAYRDLVENLVAVGNLMVLARWIRTSDGASLSTDALVAAVDEITAELVYDPLIGSWNNRGPTPETPNPPQAGSATLTWRPWVDGATIAEAIFGKATVWKRPVMIVTFDDTGRVVSGEEDAQVGTFIDNAMTSKKTEVIPGTRGDCKRWSFRVHWGTPTVTMKLRLGTQGFDFDVELGSIGSSGTDLEVYELCWDRTWRVLEGVN